MLVGFLSRDAFGASIVSHRYARASPGMDDLAFLSAVELGALLRERQVSAVEVDGGAPCGASRRRRRPGRVRRRRRRRARWRRRATVGADDRRAVRRRPDRRSRPTRPPTGLRHGLRHARCCDGHRADHDAHLVRRLRDEGFVIVGVDEDARSSGSCRPPSRATAARPATRGTPTARRAAPAAARRRPSPRGCCRSPTATTAAARSASPRRAAASSASSRAAGASRAGRTAATRSSSPTASSRAPCSTPPPRSTCCRGYEAGDATWAPPPDRARTVPAVNRDPGTLRVHVVTDNPLGAEPHPEQRAPPSRTRPTRSTELGHEVEDVDAGAARARRRCRSSSTLFGANIAPEHRPRAAAGRPRGRARRLEPLSRAMVDRARGDRRRRSTSARSRCSRRISRRVVALWADCDVMLTPALAERPPAIGTLTGFGDEDPMAAFDRAVALRALRGPVQRHRASRRSRSRPASAPTACPVAVQLVGRAAGRGHAAAGRAPARASPGRGRSMRPPRASCRTCCDRQRGDAERLGVRRPALADASSRPARRPRRGSRARPGR